MRGIGLLKQERHRGFLPITAKSIMPANISIHRSAPAFLLIQILWSWQHQLKYKLRLAPGDTGVRHRK